MAKTFPIEIHDVDKNKFMGEIKPTMATNVHRFASVCPNTRTRTHPITEFNTREFSCDCTIILFSLFSFIGVIQMKRKTQCN